MRRYILDTNIFFNMSDGLGLGKKTEEVIKKTTFLIKNSQNKEFFIPPSIKDEFLSFFENKEQSFIKDFLSLVVIKSPDYNKTSFSSWVFNLLINEVRQRNYQGLNIAEEEIIKGAKLMLAEKKISQKEFQIKIGGVIKNLRERYRKATRFGFLDSVADLDLIVLTKELDGFLVSTDEGVIRWGRLFGVKEVPAKLFVRQF